MKKYLMTVMAAVTLGGLFTGCSNDVDLNGGNTAEFDIVKNYEDAFITRFGQPHENQAWGFGESVATTRGTRSQNSPSCPHITQPYDESWVTEYLTTAKEPDSQNTVDNYDNSVYHEAVPSVWVEGTGGEWVPGTAWGWMWIGDQPGSKIVYNWASIQNGFYTKENGNISQEDWDWFMDNCLPYVQGDYQHYDASYTSENANDALTDMITLIRSTGRSSWINVWTEGSKGHYEGGGEGHWTEAQEAYYDYDETYVRNFKITGTYDGYINVAGSEGIIDGGTLSHAERTIVVTGRWNITEDQRIGSLGKIIIANGGTVNVASQKTLNMVNQAQLVVLPGGTLTGEGKVEVNNGNETGRENYNGGTVSVATFNNNFGKFYNYGDFLVDEYQGGAQESNFYNHHLVKIGHFAGTGSTANARIFNECQFYVINNARIRNYEGVGGS